MAYKVSGLRSWNLNAESFESVVRFYRDALGAEETTRHQVAGADVVRLKVGRTGLGVFNAKDGPRPGVPHHTFDFEGPRDPDVMRLHRELAKSLVEETGIDVDFRMFYGGMPRAKAEKSLRLFAEKVLPAVQAMPTPINPASLG